MYICYTDFVNINHQYPPLMFIGRLSVLSTQTNQTTTTLKMSEIGDINLPNFKDLSPIG